MATGFSWRIAGSGRTDMSRAAWLRQARLEKDVDYLDGLNTLSYAPELELRCSRRQIFFDRKLELVVIVDELESRRDHAYALHLHAAPDRANRGKQIRLFSRRRVGRRGGGETGPLYVQCLSSHAIRAAVAVGSLVLPYPYGVTRVKGTRSFPATIRVRHHPWTVRLSAPPLNGGWMRAS